MKPIVRFAIAFVAGVTLTFCVTCRIISQDYTSNKVVGEKFESRETLKTSYKPVLEVKRDYFLKADVAADYFSKAAVNADYVPRSELSKEFVSKWDVEALYLSTASVEAEYISLKEVDAKFVSKEMVQKDFIPRAEVASNYILRTEIPEPPSRISPRELDLSGLQRVADGKTIQPNDWLVFWPVPGKERAQSMLAERVDGPRKEPVVPGRVYQVIENGKSRDGNWFRLQFAESDGATATRWYLYDSKNVLTYMAPSTGLPLLRTQ